MEIGRVLEVCSPKQVTLCFGLRLLGRFATELSGRKARRKDWTDLAEEMTRAGWFDSV